MLFCMRRWLQTSQLANLKAKILTNSHTLAYSCRGKIKTKVSLTNQSPLLLDVTSQTQSVCFIMVQLQQPEERFRLCEDEWLV